MSVEFIGVHVQTRDVRAVRESIDLLFQQHGFTRAEDEPAADVLESDTGSDGEGVLVSTAAPRSLWVSVYVADWPDSGLLARHLSLLAPTLELWCADGMLWGYTLFADEVVVDRFASDPMRMEAGPAEQDLYKGDAQKLVDTLHVSSPQDALNTAHKGAQGFAGPGIDALCDALALPFAHGFIGYDMLLEEDPDDLGAALDGWPQWRHLVFTHPSGRENLTDDGL